MERTLVLLKPDAVQRGLAGEILSRFEAKGLKIVGLKMLQVSRELAEKHYYEHVGRPYYEPLMAFITSSPVVAVALEGVNAIHRVRLLVGATKPDESQPGTIRGDLSVNAPMNLVHASDAPATAAFELSIWFSPEELADYVRCDAAWLGL